MDNVSPEYRINYNHSILDIELFGDWILDSEYPDDFDDELELQFKKNSDIKQVNVTMTQVTQWNSALLTSILSLKKLCLQFQVQLDTTQLPAEMIRLIDLSSKVPKRDVDDHIAKNTKFLHNVGSNVISSIKETGEVIAFLSNASVAFISMLRGKAVYRSSDTWLVMQQTGAEAMPIVSLLNFLVGAILGYIGAMQLEKFGAEIFIGDMVGVAMTREIAAIITAIIMAGRSGAAFAAQLGTMKVNEEIDALRSMGLSPMEFLVLPRMIGMMLMMPLLAIYANFMGIFGGALVAYTMLNISLEQYLSVVIKSVGLNDLGAGIFMSLVFGAIVAVVGCQKGMSCGKSAEAVGASTTSAVVTSTVIIFVCAAILTVVYGALGI
ncbi:MAG: ABC transporter permease [gamma proteobacterium symbiont of Bathyaustriella thionipta]|nr:ABC transporter permease [gamma proteobacterium symbiont of Bathyaustriella thionipta]MCU7955739.1 ABC transporter permease [gamma proteobacterium symbiont of Bathyaustriella thionipta]MCU7965642.1 ABC transporter permease [gamma proteobacterium symbiont of Bathyaustriella thionipta]